MARTMILCWPLEQAYYRAVRQAALKMKILLRPVTPDEYELSLSDLIESPALDSIQGCDPVNMLVFCNLNGMQLNLVLHMLRPSIPSEAVLKAILTEENSHWNTKEILEQLSLEREAITNGQNNIHPNPTEEA